MLIAAARALRRARAGERRRRRILAIASGGGHWVELLRLRPAFEGHDVVWCTVDEAYRTQVGGAPFRVVPDVTRWDRLGLARASAAVLRVLLEVRPDVVVSTGALPGFFGVVLGKSLGARTAWIDSIANVEELSMSGARVGLFADLWLTQWEELARPGGPRYEGAVL
ncbi:MAG: PssD/Cps14F family polysaccharide biosynthesis glycosyltransferase [Sandaracinaceae bacterium]